MADTGYDDVVEVLPQRRRNGRYFWQAFAERLQDRFEGLPVPGEAGLFVDECLRAGARAVAAMQGNSLWEQDAPDISEKQARDIYELRIRLGLFYAASLRYLAQGVSRMRVTCGESAWKPVSEEGESFKEFAARQDGEVEVTLGSGSAPSFGEVCVVMQLFVTPEELLLLTPELAKEVCEHVCSVGPSGLFGLMLASDGQVEKTEVDVARVFLQALGQAVEQKSVKINTKMDGQVFIAPEFWLLTAPRGVDCMIEVIATRRGAKRYQFTRHEVYDALRAGGYLLGIAERDNTALCALKSKRWRKPVEMRGLCIAAGVLFSAHDVPFFEGTVTIKEENADGSSQ